MATAYTSSLGLALPTTGELSGTWGDTVNNYLTTYVDTAVAGQLAISLTGDLSLSKTTGTSLGSTSSQYAILNVTPSASTWTITVPAASQIYHINNLSSTYTFAFKASGGTAITVAAAEKCVVAYNGSNFVRVGSTSIFGAPSTAMTIDTSGNLLVGGTTQYGAAKLTITSGGAYIALSSTTGGYSLVRGFDSGTERWAIGQVAFGGADGMAFYTGSSTTERMRLDSSGNLGIGTSSPAQKLTVNNSSGATTGGIRVYATDQTYARLAIENLNGQAYHLVAGTAGASNSGFGIYDATAGVNRVQLDSSGNLGLGVTPSAWYTGGKFFQLTGDIGFTGTSNNSLRWNNYINSAGNNDIYTATGRAAKFTYDVSNGTFGWYTAPSGTAGNAITFTQAMTLDASGRLGIGTTSPVIPLQVVSGAASATDVINYNLRLGTAATGSAAYGGVGTGIYLDSWTNNNGSNTVAAIASYLVSGGSGGAATDHSGGLRLYTKASADSAPVVRATLDTSGNLGLGVTPSAWATVSPVMQLPNGNYIGSQGSVDTFYVGQNHFYNGTNFKYVINGYATQYQLGNNNGSHQWKIAGSGTAGNNISFTTAMTLDASGNLLVGTTSSPTSGVTGIGVQNAIGFAYTGSYYWSIQTNNTDFYIGSMNLSRYAQLNGITTFTAWSFSSDRRIKNSIQDISYGLAEVLFMRPRQYKFNDGNQFGIGFVAQELKEVVPEAVTGEEIEFSDDDTPQERAKKTMGVSKETLIPVLVKAIQEQQSMIQSLTDRISQLEAK